MAISVFQLESRTNNLVESHNAMLGRMISKRAKFYSFVEDLRLEIKRKEVQLDHLISGRERVFDKPDKKYEDRSKAIKKLQSQLQTKVIDVTGFLNAVTNTHNKVVNLCAVEELVECEQPADVTMLCMVCETNNRNVIMLPCNHLAMCNECFAVAPGIPCPFCDQAATGSII